MTKSKLTRNVRKFTDSKFSWIINVMSCSTLYALSANIITLGIILPDFIHHFQVSQSKLGMLGSVKLAIFDLGSGLLGGPLTQKYGCRVIAMSGLMLAAMGTLAASFVDDYLWLMVTFSIIPGFGLAGVFIPSSVIVHQYHNKRRALASSATSAGLGLATFTFPVIMSLAIAKLGWRFALVMLAAIEMQMVAAAMMFMPNPDLRVKATQTPIQQEDLEDQEPTKPVEGKNQKHKCNLDISLLKNPAFLLFIAAFALAGNAGSVYLSFAIHRGIFQGIDRIQASIIMVVFGSCSTGGRIGAGVLGNMQCTKNNSLSAACVFGTGIVTCVSLIAGDSLALHSVFAGLVGLLSGGFQGLYSTLLVDLVGLKQLPRAMGLVQMIKCLVTAVSLPIAGHLFDSTQNYEATYLLSGVTLIFSAGLLVLSGLINRRLSKELDEFN
ncbi:hypothetical protein CAPTEDRAFT_203034 [Capitella teleta]|uniref:Major facilitator superfamily (MFS) profile domain-containing protein n=1 Tax=Capitella teleta TaxID=283909 RepID=R7TNC8_CAPTE|nr:hypothetical protein CAPTEDRAFT_203034 [Capitella teleta]|eukprot:ELT95144.1 hypothetical protein CAPTEDRAFT_203034 [Capitella teleta]